MVGGVFLGIPSSILASSKAARDVGRSVKTWAGEPHISCLPMSYRTGHWDLKTQRILEPKLSHLSTVFSKSTWLILLQQYPTVLVIFFFILEYHCCDHTPSPKELGEKRVYLEFTPLLLVTEVRTKTHPG